MTGNEQFLLTTAKGGLRVTTGVIISIALGTVVFLVIL